MNESADNKTEQKREKSRYTRDLIIVAVLLAAVLGLFFLMRSRQARDTGSGAPCARAAPSPSTAGPTSSSSKTARPG